MLLLHKNIIIARLIQSLLESSLQVLFDVGVIAAIMLSNFIVINSISIIKIISSVISLMLLYFYISIIIIVNVDNAITTLIKLNLILLIS